MHITNDIRYVGVNDHEVDLFEGQYVVPNGMSYNSYAIMDEKIAIMDTVDKNFGAEWLNNIAATLDGRKPDYLVVQHMEPDHSGSILRFMEVYPSAKLVASARAFLLLQNFFGIDFADRRIVVGENDMLSLGSRTLTFITAAMVHWPEVIMTYDDRDKILFSADAFGKFGALPSTFFVLFGNKDVAFLGTCDFTFVSASSLFARRSEIELFVVATRQEHRREIGTARIEQLGVLDDVAFRIVFPLQSKVAASFAIARLAR